MNVVAFGAHPDDVDLYAGGLVALLARSGASVVIVDLTRGELGTRGTPDGRAKEAALAAEVLGVRRECLDLPDGGIEASDPDQLNSLVEAYRRHCPQLVIAPWENDLHPDHRETALLARKARFLARLTKYDAVGTPFRPGPIYYYEQKIPFEPDVVVDISAVRETKLEAIRAFGTQFFRDESDPNKTEISDPEFHEMLRARERVHGGRIGVEAGEGYKTDGPVAIADPTQLVLPGGSA